MFANLDGLKAKLSVSKPKKRIKTQQDVVILGQRVTSMQTGHKDSVRHQHGSNDGGRHWNCKCREFWKIAPIIGHNLLLQCGADYTLYSGYKRRGKIVL